MSKYFVIFASCLVLFLSTIESIKYNCKIEKKDKNISCQCTAKEGSKEAKLECKSDKGYCSSDAKDLDKNKVFIAFCSPESIGMVEKKDNKYYYSEINNLASKYENSASKAEGSIDSGKKDSLNIYKRFFEKLRSIF